MNYPVTWSDIFANAIENCQKEINSMSKEILDIKRRIADLETIAKQEVKDHDN